MTPVERIVDWVKAKPVWWRHAIRLSLRDGELTSVTLNEIYQTALMEHGLIEKDDTYNEATNEIDTIGFGVESSEVNLRSISDVVNVGALAEGQILPFSEKGLTVVYGDNGAGKSGYSRIFKHACLARGRAPEILGNVFELSSKPPSAKITVSTSGDDSEISWDLAAAPDISLKSIRVFDGDVSDNFVSDEDELGYKPLGLYLLEDLVSAIDYVKRQVVEEIMPGNGFVSLPKFGDTDAGRFIQGLSADTDIADIGKHLATDEEIKSLAVLQKEVAELKAKSPEEIRKDVTNKKRQIVSLKEFIVGVMKGLSDDTFSGLKTKAANAKEKTDLATQLRNRVLNDLPLSNIGGDEWRLMWDSAEKFILSEAGKRFPPNIGDDCPLCLQQISGESADKLKEFQEYILDETSKQAKNACTELATAKDAVKAIDLNPTPYNATIIMIDESESGFEENYRSLMAALLERKKLFLQDEMPSELDELSSDVIDVVNQLIEKAEQYLTELSDDKSSGDVLKSKEDKILEITDRALLKDNAEQVKTNILRHAAVKKYEELHGKCSTRQVTSINADICKVDVVEPIAEYFGDELKKFGFHRFEVVPQTRGKSGAQLLRLEINESGEPLVAKVASEGEQRCIAIACFLAEMRVDQRKSAVIFDDPVNSLSHQWSGKVAKRLVEVSLDRQVVVFTHDISFYKYLLEETEIQDGAEFTGICLERGRKRAGIVRTSPPWDALTTRARISELKNQLQELRVINEKHTEREFRVAAYSFYGYLREAWERLVEEKLLNQVVTRFGRGIQTNRLKRLSDLADEDFTRIETAMSKCSTYFRGHDSAPAVGDAFPTFDEVEADLTDIDDFNKELNKRRN